MTGYDKWLPISAGIVLFIVLIFLGFAVPEAVYMAIPPAFLLHLALIFNTLTLRNKIGYAALIAIVPVGVFMLGRSFAPLVGGHLPYSEILAGSLFIWSFILLLTALYLIVAAALKILFQKIFKLKNPKSVLVRMVLLLLFLAFAMPYMFLFLQIHRIKVVGNMTPETYFGAKFEKFDFTAPDGSARISGYYVPCGNSSNTGIVLHGIGVDKENFLPQAEELYRCGWNVVIFDFRGHGESPGHTSTFGVRERFDVKAAVAYLEKYHPCKKIVLYAASMGTSAALHAAADGVRVDGFILDSPISTFRAAVKWRIGSALGEYIYAGLIPFAFLDPGVNVCADSPLDLRGDFLDKPVLVFKCEKDKILPPDGADDIYGNFRGPKKLVLMEGASHIGGLFTNPQKYHSEVKLFLENTGDR